MMESDMKAVSTGTKRKSEVLESCLQQMKTCFLDAKRNKVKLLEAMEMFFERSNRSGGDTHIVEERVRLCSMCNDSDMVLKRKPSGDFMVGCQRYPLCRNVVWLPGSISEAVVTSHVCPSCTPGPVLMIQFKFRRLEIPPNYDVDHLGCIGGCDAILRELVEICGTGSRNHAGRGQGGMEPPSSLRTANSRSNSCIHCRQTGHSSDDCPSHTSHSRGSRSNSSRGAQPNSSRGARSNSVQNSRNSTGSVLCNSCGEPGVLRTANTESNRGRKFYTCQSQECGFFVWEDSLEAGGDRGCGPTRGRGSRLASTAGGDRGRGSSRGRGSRSASTTRRGGRGRGQGSRGTSEDGERFVSATGDPVSGRCYICGDPSHFANACPNRGG